MTVVVIQPHQKGLMNWQTYYKMVVLKLISFGIEYCSFFQDQANEIHLQYKKLDDRDAENSLTQARGRQGATVSSFPLRLGDFSFTNLISYALYPPLYLAGPITTFDRFVHNVRWIARQYLIGFLTPILQMQHPQTEVSTKEIVKSVIKVALYMLLMEIGLHYIYAHSFSAYGEWSRYGPATSL
jgi:D-alanyl-lipoteichoic acid acyltransferase DltB (MBOAT superfamily)